MLQVNSVSMICKKLKIINHKYTFVDTRHPQPPTLLFGEINVMYEQRPLAFLSVKSSILCYAKLSHVETITPNPMLLNWYSIIW